jgi:hypothetical protein
MFHRLHNVQLLILFDEHACAVLWKQLRIFVQNQWKELFPSMIAKASTLDVIRSGEDNDQDGVVQLVAQPHDVLSSGYEYDGPAMGLNPASVVLLSVFRCLQRFRH